MKNKTGGLKNMTNLSLDKLRKGTSAFISESDFQVMLKRMHMIGRRKK